MTTSDYPAFQKLKDIYDLLNMEHVEYHLEYDGDEWNAEIFSDGKVVTNSQIGFGKTEEDALNDAAERILSFMPILDNVPTSKIINLIHISRVAQNPV